MQNKKKRIIKWLLAAVVIIGVAARIIYINQTLPYAGVHDNTKEQILQGDQVNVKVDQTTLYTKERWLAYLQENDIKTEQEQYASIEGMAYTYDPEEEYQVLTIDVTIENRTQEDQKISLTQLIRLGNGVNSPSINSYYTLKFQSKLSGQSKLESLSANQRVQEKLVYVCTKEPKNLEAYRIQMGNNQKVKLDVKEEK